MIFSVLKLSKMGHGISHMIKIMTQLGYGWEIIPLSAAFP
ncbi:hypothetical protein O185_03635 [Photorhabdus temperata J3]|uniref:Uncharacterized protein n=1 Tax=Photorhabdus temperata J3 TaxID=1389415 RepID=U7R3H9_PHOTE|nr:hypothetical protein O185_03635 [Photorhabdus temperata J3]